MKICSIKNVFALIIVFTLCYQSAFGLHITLNSPSKTVNLGIYGDKSVTSIGVLAAVVTSSYYWEISGGWQASTGETSLQTTTNSITIVPIPGFLGCATGAVNVNGSTSSGSEFYYTAYLTVTMPSVSFSPTVINFNDPVPIPMIITGTLSNVSSLASYSWAIFSDDFNYVSLDSQTPGLYHVSNNIEFANAVNSGDGHLEVFSTIGVAVSVQGSSSCSVNLSESIGFIGPKIGDSDDGGGCVSVLYDYEGNVISSKPIICPAAQRIVNQEPIMVKGINNDSGLNIYPNPAVQELKVDFLEPAHDATFFLYNASGILMNRGEKINDNFTLNTSEFQEGFYILKVDNGGKSRSQRVIIRK